MTQGETRVEGERGPEPRRGRPRIPASQQRDRLIEAAETLIALGGDAGASVQAIVREAQMSSRSFYEFFDSKEDLLVELAEMHAARFLSRIEATRATADGASAGMARFLRVYFESLPILLVDLERLGGRGRARVRAVRDRVRRQLGAWLEADFTAFHARGEIPRLPPATVFALALHGLEALALEHRGWARSVEHAAGAPPTPHASPGELARELTELFAQWVAEPAADASVPDVGPP